MRQLLAEKKRQMALSLLMAYPFILYILALIAPYANSFEELIYGMDHLSYRPVYCGNTIKVCFFGSVIYAMVGVYIVTSMKNYRNDEEHGSAKFGSVRALKKLYACKVKIENLRLTENIMLGFDVFRHQLNLNSLIIGGSGTWKSRGFILPNLLLGGCSFVVTDPKGELLHKIGKFLLKILGYDVRVLDLKNHEKSMCYNPFAYFRNDNDILDFVNGAWEAMSDKKATRGEEIWSEQSKAMLISFMMYLFHYAPPEEQNFPTVMKMIHEVKTSEGMKQEISAIDILFTQLDTDDPAFGYYKTWSSAKGRTLASILATLQAKMTVFNLESMRKLTYCDELALSELGTKKVALFCITPDNTKSYNFLAGIMYTQLIQQLYDYADNVCHGPLPQKVMFLWDEFANIALPDDYEQILSTARSRNIGFAIVLQNKQQIEALYKEVYQSMIGNCDTFLFLGSNELETCKYFSELMGDETVIVRTYNKTYGMHGSITRQENKVARKLMTPDELRKLNKRKAILIIRGEDPVIDNKIVLRKCKNYKHLADGLRTKKNAYDWGQTNYASGTVDILPANYSNKITPLPRTTSRLMEEDELQKLAS